MAKDSNMVKNVEFRFLHCCPQKNMALQFQRPLFHSTPSLSESTVAYAVLEDSKVTSHVVCSQTLAIESELHLPSADYSRSLAFFHSKASMVFSCFLVCV